MDSFQYMLYLLLITIISRYMFFKILLSFFFTSGHKVIWAAKYLEQVFFLVSKEPKVITQHFRKWDLTQALIIRSNDFHSLIHLSLFSLFIKKFFIIFIAIFFLTIIISINNSNVLFRKSDLFLHCISNIRTFSIQKSNLTKHHQYECPIFLKHPQKQTLLRL